MEIGIITWFTGTNYGTHLQAIALQQYLRNNGHGVQIINYEPIDHNNVQKSFLQKLADWNNLYTRIRRQPEKYVFKWANRKYRKEIEQRNQSLACDIKTKCNLTERICNESELINCLNQFDLLVCGSDQIWNPHGYDPFYYADFEQVKTKRISYAPSLGVNAILENRMEDIKRGLSKFSAVSVREEQGAKLLRYLMDSEPFVVLDPTFLLNREEWETIFPQRESEDKYILSMFLTDNIDHWKAARYFAKSHGLRHIVIPYCGISYIQKADIRAGADLQGFLDLIRDAEYVLTDSFHVTVFALIFQKQFFTFTRFKEDAYTSQNARVRNLLKIACLDERFLTYGTTRVSQMPEIDYDIVAEVLRVEIDKSKDFLDSVIPSCLK